MKIKLKNLSEQVVVITGATSGIGLTTARMAARKGAKLVLAARNEEALRRLVEEINSAGGEAIYVKADVGREGDVKKIAAGAVARFGNFDTWVNNAGVSVYGKYLDVPTEDQRQIFETNYWGLVYGTLTAARHLKLYGGAIVNVGSVLSDRAVPLQGTYSASKHAVKGFTDSFRMELEAENAPVSVSLIKPSAIDTPYKDHARNYLPVKAENPPPVYAPETVAEAILHCAENSERDVYVGGGGKVFSFFGDLAPRLADVVIENTILPWQQKDEPNTGTPQESLYQSNDASMRERGGYEGHVMESSVYTKASLHPVITGAALLALGAGLGYTLLKRK